MNKLEQEKLQAKWERILEKRGLGIYQAMTDNSEGDSAESPIAVHDNFKALRQKVDGSDMFMEGHQIKKVRTEERETPEWAMNDKALEAIILRAYPKAKTTQARKAGFSIRVAYLYYRMGMTYSQVAKEMGVSQNRVSMTLRGLNYTVQGRSKDGRPRKRT